MAEQDRRARVFAHNQESLRQAVRNFDVWHERLRELDMNAVGLPPIGRGADAFRPVAHDVDFCYHLPPGEALSAVGIISEYRQHAQTWLDTRSPENWADYRGHFLAERHLARLACQVSTQGDEHAAAFRELLSDEHEGIQYVAAIHCINHELDIEAGYHVLRQLVDSYEHFEVAKHALEQNGPPLRLGYEADDFREEALFFLAPDKSRGRRVNLRGGGTL